jgi:hypothetical protein
MVARLMEKTWVAERCRNSGSLPIALRVDGVFASNADNLR